MNFSFLKFSHLNGVIEEKLCADHQTMTNTMNALFRVHRISPQAIITLVTHPLFFIGTTVGNHKLFF